VKADITPPFAYYGSKVTVADRIVAALPAHQHYVEPFAGSLSVLMAKPPTVHETVNDLDGDLMAFWRVLREQPTELARVCALTPHARQERNLAAEWLNTPAEDRVAVPDLEVARLVWVALSQGRAGVLRRTGWKYCINPAGSSIGMPRYLEAYVDRMAAVSARLQRVSLECRPALDIIRSFGACEGVLLYVDPPYLGTSRSNNPRQYRHEMHKETEHRELAEALTACRAAVVLSGYASPLYDQLYQGWHVTRIATATGQGGTWSARTEVLWSNRAPEPNLFDADGDYAAAE
jgi:DNA adenine methylase